MEETIENLIKSALKELGIEIPKNFNVEHPANLEFGDYSTNVGIVTGKTEEIAEALRRAQGDFINKIEVKAGFINFFLSKKFFVDSLEEIIKEEKNFGRNERLKGEKIMVEHTDPNPFKIFHIGHFMPNVIGTAISHLLEWNGAEVKQTNYQGDVGLHVAKAVYRMKKGDDWKIAYANGDKEYSEKPEAKKEIEEINKKIYDRSDPEINKLYEGGKKESLEYFDSIYKKLGTKFDYSIFESDVESKGKQIVLDNLGKVFEESEGAVVFKGSHTRVFVNSQRLPTYEAKELGNAEFKYEKYQYTKSIIVTANEIKDYFKVILEAMNQVLPKLASKTIHITHGLLKLPTGKMSSRTGTIISAESLIEKVKEVITEKGQTATDDIAIGAIKYTILKQSIGNNIIFDFEKSVSTEGDSGPYLQYACARTNSLLEKAKRASLTYRTGGASQTCPGEARAIEKLLYRFPEIVERAGEEYAPQLITTYLIELSSAFNNFYAQEQIISEDAEAPYRLAIVKAFNLIIKNGLSILGISTPERI